MTDYLTLFKDYVIELGEKHDVDPLLLGCLYFISKPSFITSLAWLLKNFRAKKSILIPILFAAVSFSLPYVYLITAGRNIPVWVYVFICLMFIYGGFTIWKKITTKPILAD
ncbi:hypothetical protein SNE25_01765 [Mucilaginibacter sabulilitoris]|uniref:Uncharacterized protein n=1 Tax=Mucilaginibacter sabulilitoris TaxID=1173583 RepID=A0ABZ0TNB2_9SPHI|nr:hypothetical protein [Mucilaginibacter sabulilitoris]WPU94251.1 hypothetical protein SNE25_01765 [Mucilaginibacter sabulilitoris]